MNRYIIKVGCPGTAYLPMTRSMKASRLSVALKRAVDVYQMEKSKTDLEYAGLQIEVHRTEVGV